MPTRLRGTYPMAVAIALLGLCPNLVLSTGLLPLTDQLARDLGTSTTWLQVASGLSNAALATGDAVTTAVEAWGA